MKAPKTKLVAVLQTFLTGLLFPVSFAGAPCPFHGQPLFQAVRLFDMENILDAFAELLLFKDRVAIIVLAQERQASHLHGLIQVTVFHSDFAILISDRNYADRQLALHGNATTPGVLLLSDVLAEAAMGEIAPGYLSEAGGGDLLGLTGKDRDNNIGRIAWRQDLTLHGGRIEKNISRLALTTYAPTGA